MYLSLSGASAREGTRGGGNSVSVVAEGDVGIVAWLENALRCDQASTSFSDGLVLVDGTVVHGRPIWALRRYPGYELNGLLLVHVQVVPSSEKGWPVWIHL